MKKYKTVVVNVPENESEGKWDYKVIVWNLENGKSASEKVSGGQQIIEAINRKLRKEVR